MKITNKEIAKYIGKTDSAISYVKKSNPKEYEILRLGYLCKKYDLDEAEIALLSSMKKKIEEAGNEKD